MNGRAAILGKIGKSLGGNANDAARAEAVRDRLANPPNGIIPQRGQLSQGERVRLFVEMAEAVQATTAQVSSTDDVAEAVADYLRSRNLPQTVKTGSDKRLDDVDWSRAPSLSRTTGASDGDDPVGLSFAAAGVAETGTLVLTSGPDNPTTLNFLPENHIVIVNASDVAGDYESVLKNARQSDGSLPRTVNLITGPSRSGDIEQTLLLGAHGPRNLHIIVVQGDVS